MTIAEAKKIDMVEYLASLGYQPASTKQRECWYHSPFHADKTPSFKINRSMNRWYDFGEGTGGNLIDFGVKHFNCSVKDFLQQLDRSPLHSVPTIRDTQHHQKADTAAIDIKRVLSIRSLPLLRYLRQRRIPQHLADQYLKEVHYSLNGKSYYALGFRNDAGGYELRNEYMKGSSSPKSPTTLSIHGNQPYDTMDIRQPSLAVFEGFMDFLSYLALAVLAGKITDFLILNSLSFFDKQLPRMQEFNKVHLFLDNDSAGNKMTATALQLDPHKFQDERKLYKNYADLNEWCQQQGKSNRQQQKP